MKQFLAFFSRIVSLFKAVSAKAGAVFSAIRRPKLSNRGAPAKGAVPPPPPAPAPLIVRQDEKHPSEAYMDLKMKFRDIGKLGAVAETMGRDFLTAMPEGAWKSRLSQISFLHERLHRELSDPEMLKQVERAKSHLANHEEDWDAWDQANLREMEAECRRARFVDMDLHEQEARLDYQGRRRHSQALAAGDWTAGREALTRALDTKKRVAEAMCRGSGENDPYQLLLNEYSPDIKLQDVETWFEDLRGHIGKILPKIQEKQAAEDKPLAMTDFYPAKAQMWLNRALLEEIGFDFQQGGLYETGHNPVEGGTPEDTRLVIKIADTTNFLDSMKSTLHEGGHGIYTQGLPRKSWRYQPVGQDMGSAVHESQALLMEMVLGRTEEFWEFIAPRVQGLFHGLKNPVLSPENLWRTKTRVTASLNRKKADEVTYFLHVYLRFQLEKEMINGSLSINELPDRWNELAESVLGVRPETHADGVLQDVHWFVGKFGYFPAYTLGHMMAAQQYETLQKTYPDLKEQLRNGDFSKISGWLRENVHSKGRVQDTYELMSGINGVPPGPDALKRHLESRYLS